jgi:hypothetical protein
MGEKVHKRKAAKKEKEAMRIRYVDPLIHKDVQCKFAMFLQDFPPREFNRILRDLLIDYLVERGSTNYRIDTTRMSQGIWALMRVLDEAEDHWNVRDIEEILELHNGYLKSK